MEAIVKYHNGYKINELTIDNFKSINILDKEVEIKYYENSILRIGYMFVNTLEIPKVSLISFELTTLT